MLAIGCFFVYMFVAVYRRRLGYPAEWANSEFSWIHRCAVLFTVIQYIMMDFMPHTYPRWRLSSLHVMAGLVVSESSKVEKTDLELLM